MVSGIIILSYKVARYTLLLDKLIPQIEKNIFDNVWLSVKAQFEAGDEESTKAYRDTLLEAFPRMSQQQLDSIISGIRQRAKRGMN